MTYIVFFSCESVSTLGPLGIPLHHVDQRCSLGGPCGRASEVIPYNTFSVFLVTYYHQQNGGYDTNHLIGYNGKVKFHGRCIQRYKLWVWLVHMRVQPFKPFKKKVLSRGRDVYSWLDFGISQLWTSSARMCLTFIIIWSHFLGVHMRWNDHGYNHRKLNHHNLGYGAPTVDGRNPVSVDRW